MGYIKNTKHNMCIYKINSKQITIPALLIILLLKQFYSEVAFLYEVR